MLKPRLWQQQPWRQAQCLFRSSTNAFARRTYASATDTPKVATATRETTSSTTTDTVAFNPPTAAPSRRRGGFELRTYKPRTPSMRHLRRPINDHLWKGKPLAKLTFAKVGHGKGGRNCTGRITVRHHGGGHRRRIRTVDFKRMEPGKHTVERIEYDPNRSTHLALVTREKTGEKSYVLAADGMRAGDVIESYRAGIPGELLKSMGGVMDPGMLAAKTAFRGNCLPVRMIPLGTQIYAVGSTTGKGAVFCRSAGTFAVVVSKEEVGKKVKEVTVRLQSGEVRRVSPEACATIGVASNPHHHFATLGKAGRSRWLNIRPTVRGLAMNAGKFDSLPDATILPCLTILFLQPTILTVVVEVNQRVTSTPSPSGAPQQRVVTRPVQSATPTSTLCKSASATKAREGQARTKSRLLNISASSSATCTVTHVNLKSINVPQTHPYQFTHSKYKAVSHNRHMRYTLRTIGTLLS
jgi:ribosomal protein L2